MTTDARRVLIVEDDAYQATWFASVLTRAGYAVVGPAADELSALMLIGENPPDAALVDVDLSGARAASPGGARTSAQVVAALADWGVPIVVVSSHPEVGFLPPADPGMIRLRKPARERDLVAALRTVLGRRQGAIDPQPG